MTREIGVKHDPAERLWGTLALVHQDREADGLKMGGLLFKLQNLYSERADSGDSRRSSGHGVFVAELKKRGYDPRRSRELIFDYKADRDGTPSTADLRKARREAKAAKAARINPVSNDLARAFSKLLRTYEIIVGSDLPDHTKCALLDESSQALESRFKAATAAKAEAARTDVKTRTVTVHLAAPVPKCHKVSVEVVH